MGSTTAVGSAIALAIYSSILRNKANSDLVPNIAAAAIEAGLAPAEVPTFVRMV
jgi:hypothetical protein